MTDGLTALVQQLPRYSVSEIDGMLLPNPTPDGGWVRFADIEAALAALVAPQPELVKAFRAQLDEWQLWHDDPGAAFELLADEFYRETGLMAPGKSIPAAMGPHDDARRRTEWEAWQQARRGKRQAKLNEIYNAFASLAPPPQTEPTP